MHLLVVTQSEICGNLNLCQNLYLIDHLVGIIIGLHEDFTLLLIDGHEFKGHDKLIGLLVGAHTLTDNQGAKILFGGFDDVICV